MSEKKDSTKKYYFSSGVFKFDYRSAGYPDLMKIAQEWAKDPNFYEIIVRGVSEKNLGIQFVYISLDSEKNIMHEIKDELVKKYGDRLYAWDYNTSSFSGSELERFDDIIVLKEFKKPLD